MTLSLTLHLSPFGLEALERSSREHGGSPGALIRSAALAYVASGRRDRLARRPLPLLRDHARDALPVQVTLDEELWLSLTAEARHYQVELPRLLEHATLLYLADLDSGRIAARVGDALLGGE